MRCQLSPKLTFFKVNYFVDVQMGAYWNEKGTGIIYNYDMYVLVGRGLPSET